MELPSLTIGTAVYDDFDGAYFTIQSLRMHHPDQINQIILVDNDPNETQTTKMLQHLCGNAGAKYIHYTEKVGTAAPRHSIFDNAISDIVLCVDSHVLIPPGVLKRLREWVRDNPDTEDLLQGPMLYDNFENLATHFDDEWRSEMWGVWGDDERAHDENAEPFEIWGQGMGLFACRKESWLGFNPHFLGFGGEEGYIHTKYRKAGHKTLCLPFLRWGHRFGRPRGVSYPLTLRNKIRNYVLGHQELNLPLDPIYEHFVKTNRISEAEWNQLIKDPVNNLVFTPPSVEDDPDSALFVKYEKAKTQVSDINEHCETLRKYAEQSETFVEFGTRHGVSSVAILSGRLTGSLNKFTSYDINASCPVRGLTKLGKGVFKFKEGDSLSVNIDQTDSLFIDTKHTEDQLYGELTKHHKQVNRWIIMHDTELFAQRGELHNTRGLIFGLKRFMSENEEWFIAEHFINNNGLTVISKNEEDRPDKEVILWSPEQGPGTELKNILSSLGINPGDSCDCNQKMAQMNTWGIEGCEENFEVIIDWLKEGSDKWGWTSKLSAGIKAITTGLAFKIAPLDPYPSLVKEAIRRTKVLSK